MQRVMWLVAATGALLVGCTPPEEKVQKLMNASVAECQKGTPPFAEVAVFEKEQRAQLLREACDEPITDIKIEDGFKATAKTGPYVWTMEINDTSKVWVLRSIEWEPMDHVLRTLKVKEPSVNELERVEVHLAAAQAGVPRSAWVRHERIKNLMRIAWRTRKADGEPGIGEAARAVYGETLTWSAQVEDADAGEQAKRLVIDELIRQRQQALDEKEGLGSQDDYLIKSVEIAKKEKDKEAAAKYQQELDERRAKRPEVAARLQARADKLHELRCVEVKRLNPQVVKDGDLRTKLQTLQGNSKCDGG